MKDINRTALAAAVAGGYVLGRTKKGRMALAVGTYLAGRRLGLDPQQLMAQGVKTLKDAPQLAGLGDQVRGELMDAGRQALAATADRKMAGLADALHERTQRLEGRGEADEKDQRDTEAADGADEPEEDQKEEPEEDQKEQEDQKSKKEREGARSELRSRRAAAGKTAKKAPAGTPAAKKATARAAAKKAATTGKAPAKRAPSRTDATSGSGTRRR